MNSRQLGKGSPVVLLHSLLADSSSFEALAASLSATFRVIVFDLPGYRGAPTSADTIPEVAHAIVMALDGLGVVGAFDVLGNGYGGFLALAVAEQFTDRVRRLVLLDSAAAFPPPAKDAVRAMKEAVQLAGMQGVLDIALQRLFPPAFAGQRPDIVAACSSALLKMDPVAFSLTCRNLIDVDLRPGLASVRSETLVVVGLEDKATPIDLAREMALAIPGAQIRELEGCGHAPHIQVPELAASIVGAFLAAPHPR
jgi:3-oxoadipate enol-lactonase